MDRAVLNASSSQGRRCVHMAWMMRNPDAVPDLVSQPVTVVCQPMRDRPRGLPVRARSQSDVGMRATDPAKAPRAKRSAAREGGTHQGGRTSHRAAGSEQAIWT